LAGASSNDPSLAGLGFQADSAGPCAVDDMSAYGDAENKRIAVSIYTELPFRETI